MKIAVCPGSFDPVTNGHIDIIERASTMFDELIVGVFHNVNKKPLFTMQERVTLLAEATKHLKNVRVTSFHGLLNEYVKQQGSRIIVRGLRAMSDFEYEFQRALLLKHLDPEIETVFMMTSNEYSFLSSSGIRELANFQGEIKGLVPKCVEIAIKQKVQNKS
ncbi:Phosphopantetheine adenylyltransferase [Propionispira arboris]|uniref:Phosphopantetheine adenylyltransferase n=1 Tax=Propionispira arboris TaxID=84035 RepID=A0A1H6W5R5_9FIRM|nr:pantetheine-phosphate adenylyltransferase [Propionispira arboris]SEJ07625.1 Phosphopantetheine adenylyltransferase [Propionispira arboris]